jgi:hypothetical protein
LVPHYTDFPDTPAPAPTLTAEGHEMSGSSKWLSRVYCALPTVLVLGLLGVLAIISLTNSQELGWMPSLLGYLKNSRPQMSADFDSDHFRQMIDFKGSLFYRLIVILYLGSCCFAARTVIYIIGKPLNGGTWRRGLVLTLLLGALLIGILFSVAQGAPYQNICARQNFWSLMACNTINNASVFMLDAKKLHLLLDAIGVVATTLLAFAASVVLCSKDQTKSETTQVKNRMQCLLLILYAGAALLVIEILRLSAVLHWSMSYLQPLNEEKEALHLYENLSSVISDVITVMGSLYTLLLAALYVPAAIILNGQSTSKKVDLPVSTHLLRLAAILGPLLAGPVGELLSRLKK